MSSKRLNKNASAGVFEDFESSNAETGGKKKKKMTKNFNKAYRDMIQEMYNENGK